MTTAVISASASGTEDLSVWPASTTRLAAGGRLGGGRIVIDSPSEIARIAATIGPDGRQKNPG
ncbi:hypothetical protein [Streptomyces sp. NBC_01276]|uniref:hypothetical protein n=1 Tax=Streptomyces sp. NBC_01276 TaxID=2903808 RepID=UPI00352FCE5C